MSESSKHLHQQHAEARLFKERYEERFGPLQHSGRPSSTPLAKESRLLSKSYRRLDIKPARFVQAPITHFLLSYSFNESPKSIDLHCKTGKNKTGNDNTGNGKTGKLFAEKRENAGKLVNY